MKSLNKLKFYYCNQLLGFIYNYSGSSSGPFFLHYQVAVLLCPVPVLLYPDQYFLKVLVWMKNTDTEVLVPDAKALVHGYENYKAWNCCQMNCKHFGQKSKVMADYRNKTNAFRSFHFWVDPLFIKTFKFWNEFKDTS